MSQNEILNFRYGREGTRDEGDDDDEQIVVLRTGENEGYAGRGGKRKVRKEGEEVKDREAKYAITNRGKNRLHASQITLQIHACFEAEQDTSVRKSRFCGEGVVASADEGRDKNIVCDNLITTRFELVVVSIWMFMADDDLRPVGKLVPVVAPLLAVPIDGELKRRFVDIMGVRQDAIDVAKETLVVGVCIKNRRLWYVKRMNLHWGRVRGDDEFFDLE